MHLSSTLSRQIALHALLGRQAANIDPDDEFTKRILFDTFYTPQRWVFEAKALYARAVLRDRLAEVRFLQRAQNWAEAHTVLCTSVAPKAIIERDYDILTTLLREFGTPGHGPRPQDWRVGGGVYADFLALLDAQDGDEKKGLLLRLLKSVPEMATYHSSHSKHRQGATSGIINAGVGREKGSESETFLRSVAVQEMGRVVGETVLGTEGFVSL